MIYITGDVHSKNLLSWEHEGYGSNAKTSIKYLEILKKYGLSSTLFVNGVCLDEENVDIKKLLDYDVEFGGHTYDNFGNNKLNIFKSYINRKFFNCVYGPEFYQKKDIKKTRQSFERFGLKMNSWRTHAFGSNNKTFEILQQNGVKYVSDLLGCTKPFYEKGIIHIPINIPVDQSTMAFGPVLNPENRSPFAGCTKGRINPEEWLKVVLDRVHNNEKNGIPSVLLLHPATMAYIDNFRLFEKLIKSLSNYESAKISEFKLD